MRVPSRAIDHILGAVQPMLPEGILLERAGSHGVAAISSLHRVNVFVQTPWPLPPGPRRWRVKSSLVDFADSLAKLISTTSGRPWPGPNQVLSVHVSKSSAVVTVIAEHAELSIDLPLEYWTRANS